MEELKPCPFCGGKAERIELEDDENFGGDVITCTKCNASSHVEFGFKENLVDHWNPRAGWQSEGATAISAERQRQIESEGWTPEHDDSENKFGGLLSAAISYAQCAEWCEEFSNADDISVPYQWPWAEAWWKPSLDPIRNLEKAGALIAAEIDRLQRMKKQTEVESETR